MTDRREPDRMPQEVAAAIAGEVRAPALSAERRQAMRARVLAAAATPGTRVLRAEEGEWVEFVHGIRIKTLRRDEDAGTQTSLWRLEPGAKVPPHSHKHEEECLVLEGSIIHDGVHYHAGDFLHALPKARHKPFESPDGALLMIRSELVPKLGWLTRTALRFLLR